MSVCIDQVLDYLDTHPICYYANNMESLLETLYRVYADHNKIDSEVLGGLRPKAEGVLNRLSSADGEALRFAIQELCTEHEQLAFIHGFIVGLQLMTEIRTVI